MRLFTLLLIFSVSFTAFSQSAKPDSRLQEHFTSSQLSHMDANRAAYWNYYLDNSFSIMDIAEEKSSHLSNLEEIDIDLDSFHGLSMKLDAYQKEGAYLKIKGQDKMLVIKPMKQFIAEFNTYYQSQK
jgi:hypothetical protein